MNAYEEDVHEPEKIQTTTELLRVILDAKYEKAHLNRVMENQCQQLKEAQRNELLQLLHKSEELFHGKLVTWKTDPV